MYKSLRNLVTKVYEHDGYDVTACEPPTGPSDLHAHKETTDGLEKSVDIIIVAELTKPGVILTKIAQLAKTPTDVDIVVDSTDTATRLYDLFCTPLQVVNDATGLCYRHPQPLRQNGALTVLDKPSRWVVSTDETPQIVDPIISLPLEEIRELNLDSNSDLGLPRYEHRNGRHTVIQNGTPVAAYETHSELQDAYSTVHLPVVPPQPGTDTAVRIRLVGEQTLVDCRQLAPQNHPDTELSMCTDPRSSHSAEWSWAHLVRDAATPVGED